MEIKVQFVYKQTFVCNEMPFEMCQNDSHLQRNDFRLTMNAVKGYSRPSSGQGRDKVVFCRDSPPHNRTVPR